LRDKFEANKKEDFMEKTRIFVIIAISGFMVLSLSGMARAIGFTYADTSTNASGGGITYILDVNDSTHEASLTVMGGDSNWDLDWVAFKLEGVKFSGSDNDGFVEFDLPDLDLGDGVSQTFDLGTISWSGTIPDMQGWSLKAGYYGPLAGNSGKPKTDQLSVMLPEPGSLYLVGMGLLCVAAYSFARCRRKN
jgi:hypothetical protein